MAQMKVRNTYRVNVPKHMIIDSCNLKLNESIGQGNSLDINSFYVYTQL